MDAQVVMNMYKLKALSCALELCTDTLKKDERLRLHGHWFVESHNGCPLRLRSPKSISFRGVPGHVTQGGYAQVATRGAAQKTCGHYYLLMPKVGALFSSSPLMPFRDFRVSLDWIEAFVAAGRMSFSSASIELARACKHAEAKIANPDFCERFLENSEHARVMDARRRFIHARAEASPMNSCDRSLARGGCNRGGPSSLFGSWRTLENGEDDFLQATCRRDRRVHGDQLCRFDMSAQLATNHSEGEANQFRRGISYMGSHAEEDLARA